MSVAEPFVTEKEALPFDLPMRAPYRSAQRTTTVARNVLVRLMAQNEGRTWCGWGESSPAEYVTGETQESVLRALSADGSDAEFAASPGAFGAMEMALIDANGQQEAKPAFQILNPMRTMPTLSWRTDLSLPILPVNEITTRASEAGHNGFGILKLKVGSGDFGLDLERVRGVAAAAPNAILRLDGNQGFPADDAVRFIESLNDLHGRIQLFEQPTQAGDDDAMRSVTSRIHVPVFADEAVKTVEDARRLVSDCGCKGVVLKLAKSGLFVTQYIARAVHEGGGVCLMGCMMESRIGIAAALHLAVALGGEICPYLDLDGHMLVNDEEFVSGGFTQVGDMLTLDANAPGLGITRVKLPGTALAEEAA